ncbi:MAG: hypothetical protein ABS948_05155 [Solibacillus sp.]
MFKKILLILMVIAVTLPNIVIDLSPLRASASGYEVHTTNNGSPMYVTGDIPAQQVVTIEGANFWVSSQGVLLETNKDYYLDKGFKRHDYTDRPTPHDEAGGQPTGNIADRFSEIESMVSNPSTRDDRNGWSGFAKECYSPNVWTEVGRYNTTDSDPINEYLPTEAEWDEFYTKYPSLHPNFTNTAEALNGTLIVNKNQALAEYVKLYQVKGNPVPSMNEQLPEYNQSILYTAATGGYLGHVGVEGDNLAQVVDCEVGDKLVYYNDLNFFFYMTFEVTGDPVTTGCVPTSVGECCPNPAWVAANPEQAAIDCPPPPTTGCAQTDPLCHPPTKTGCPNNPPPGESCTPDTDKSGDKTTFETKPRTYAELKDGTVYNEKWDAMAGVPTTRNLYYGIGGNEYMVKVELELVRGAIAERDYRFEYKEVMNNPCLYGNVCSRSQELVDDENYEKTSCGSRPSEPSLNSWTDLDGKVYTQTWHTEYIERCGSDENPKSRYGGYRKGIGEKDGYQGGSNANAEMVGGYTYEWTQRLKYDYVKVNKAEVWKLEGGKLAGLATSVDNIRGTSFNSEYNKMSTGNDVVTASVKYGASTDNGKVLFQQFGDNGSAESGRIRYTFEQSDAESAKKEWTN